jgi:glycosyltransferase involved in cell wall biosynthesis
MEKNKKRLIFFMPSMEGGGVEKNLILIANYISKYKDNVQLITFDDNFNKFFNKKILIKNVIKKNQKKYSKYYKYFFCLSILVKEYFNDKNFVLFSFQANIYALILSYFLNFKIISRSNSSPSGWNKNFFKNLIFKFFFKRADCIIVNSKEFQKEFKKKFKINSNLIYNPLNKKEILKKSNFQIKDKIFKTGFLKIINIARFTDQKDHSTLIEAIKIISKKISIELIMIGYGSNKLDLQNKINKYKLKKNIKIINYKTNPFPYLKASELFILSSKYEGLPNVILEAQTLKKYVISTDCPTGPREILLNGEIGSLFEVGDYNNLAKLIIQFNENKKFFKKKSKRAFAMLSRFDFEKNCKKYLFLVNKYI